MKKIFYAPSSAQDVNWFKKYYDTRPELAENGLSNYRKTKKGSDGGRGEIVS